MVLVLYLKYWVRLPHVCVSLYSQVIIDNRRELTDLWSVQIVQIYLIFVMSWRHLTFCVFDSWLDECPPAWASFKIRTVNIKNNMSAVTEETSRGQRTTSMLMITVSLSLSLLSPSLSSWYRSIQLRGCRCPPACLSVHLPVCLFTCLSFNSNMKRRLWFLLWVRLNFCF